MTVFEPISVPDPSAESSAADFSVRVAEERFIEAMGLAHEEDRLPRIAGRLVGLLILSPEPVRFDHLAARLRVSRASISTNTRLLENMGVIQRVTRPGDRRDYFKINEEPGLLLRIVDRYRARQASAEEMKRALQCQNTPSKSKYARGVPTLRWQIPATTINCLGLESWRQSRRSFRDTHWEIPTKLSAS